MITNIIDYPTTIIVNTAGTQGPPGALIITGGFLTSGQATGLFYPLNNNPIVYQTGNQTISGLKSFSTGLNDINNIQSVDLNNRILLDNAGNTIIDWQNYTIGYSKGFGSALNIYGQVIFQDNIQFRVLGAFAEFDGGLVSRSDLDVSDTGGNIFFGLSPQQSGFGHPELVLQYSVNAQSGYFLQSDSNGYANWKPLYVNPPANTGSAGQSGNFAFDTGFFYVCISNNHWKRTALSHW